MAVAPTGAIFKSLLFDGQSSRNYGVYITGQAVYNAPQRAVEMISIPNRNGAFALDKGYFENIEVTYPAGIFADNEADFAEAISDFRNFLCSRKGYVRLSDEYNPNEYRMAIYKSGLEVSPAQLKAGEFNIVFDCKPQRWLASGEAAITVSSGDTVTNPTLFDASPMLEVEGYGTIGFNGYEIKIASVPLGTVMLDAGSGRSIYLTNSDATFSFSPNTVMTGDALYFGDAQYPVQFGISDMTKPTDTVFTDSNPDVSGTSLAMWFENVSFVKGTPKTITNTRTYTSATYPADSASITATINYDGNETFTFSASKVTGTHIDLTGLLSVRWYSLYGNSTVQAIGHPTYIDCDLGEAYMIENGEYVSLNQHIDLGSDLPKLLVGGNEITCDNTITDLKVRPRWWKV